MSTNSSQLKSAELQQVVINASARINELKAALAGLEQYVRDLSEQSDSSALDHLNTLRRGYCSQYETAREVLAK